MFLTIILLVLLFILIGVTLYFYNKQKKYQKLFNNVLIEKNIFFNSTLEGIIIWNHDNTIQEANKTFLKLSRYNRDQIIGKNIFDFVDPKDYDNFHTNIFEQKSNCYELHIMKNDGEVFLAKVARDIFMFNNQETIVWFVTDLSKIKQKEIELERLNKLLEKKVKDEVQANREKDRSIIEKSKYAQLGEMISMIAHQWRQPLTAISATCNNIILQTMASKKLDPQEIQKELELVTGYTQYLSDTIDDFRNFFKKKKHKETISLDQIINETLHIISSTIENHHIELITHLNSKTPISTYDGEIKQVILSIIKNAHDALTMNDIKSPFIEIETKSYDDYVELLITDNAKGIPLNIMDKIFEPYFSTKKELDGTGLGLYMSKIIVEKNCNGKLFAANKKDGAVFSLQLPINNN